MAGERALCWKGFSALGTTESVVAALLVAFRLTGLGWATARSQDHRKATHPASYACTSLAGAPVLEAPAHNGVLRCQCVTLGLNPIDTVHEHVVMVSRSGP